MSIDPDKCSSDDNVQHDSNNQVCDSDINYESDTKCNSDNSGKTCACTGFSLVYLYEI